MNFEHNKNYKIFGKCNAFNTSDGIINMVVTLPDDSVANIKVKGETDLEEGKVYLFDFNCVFNGTRNHLILNNYTDIMKCELNEDTYEVLKKFYDYVSVGIDALSKKLDMYLGMIKNEKIKAICDDIFARYRHDFLIYPAAVKMHHNYIGGLAYHTLTMVELALPFAEMYDCLDKDLIIAGTLLHDITKVVEFKSPTDDVYSKKGQLLGHLVMGAIEVDETAKRLGIADSDEALMIEHMIVSHHGNPQFGACRKPETPEALLLWLIDSLDSKLRVINEAFEAVEPGEFTENLGVMERTKVYKKNF